MFRLLSLFQQQLRIMSCLLFPDTIEALHQYEKVTIPKNKSNREPLAGRRVYYSQQDVDRLNICSDRSCWLYGLRNGYRLVVGKV